MTYTLWRNNVQIGHTVGEVRVQQGVHLSANLVLTDPFPIGGGFTQMIRFEEQGGGFEQETSPRRVNPLSASVNRLGHSSTGQDGYPCTEVLGPRDIEIVDESRMLVLRDPTGSPVNAGMIWISDFANDFADVFGAVPDIDRKRLPLRLSVYVGNPLTD